VVVGIWQLLLPRSLYDTHLETFPQADAVAQTTALSLGVAFPLVLLILAWRVRKTARFE
jgi:hypothetical protein